MKRKWLRGKRRTGARSPPRASAGCLTGRDSSKQADSSGIQLPSPALLQGGAGGGVKERAHRGDDGPCGSHSELDFVGVVCVVQSTKKGGLARFSESLGVELFRRRIAAHSPTYANAARRTTEPIIIISPQSPAPQVSRAAFPSTYLGELEHLNTGTVSL